MLPPSKDIIHRRPVWEALSELFLDTELDERDHRRIAETLAVSGYSDEDLAEILYGEVYPVCIWNLRSVAGEWAGFDADQLQERILANERKFWLGWRILQPDRWMIRAEWNAIKSLTREQQTGRERRPP